MISVYRILFISLLIICVASSTAQPVLVLEKIGSSRRHVFRQDDHIKLRIGLNEVLVEGTLILINDSAIGVSNQRLVMIPLDSITAVHIRFGFPDRLGSYLMIFSGALFGIMAINHLVNNEQVFTDDMFIIAGSFAGGGVISKVLSRKRCKVGPGRWKLKTFNQDLFME